jgi:ABC-type dipeptide/oligopeptide/nickel transport system permease subunit
MLAEIHVQSITASQWWMLLPAVVLVPLLAGYYSLSDVLQKRAGFVQV